MKGTSIFDARRIDQDASTSAVSDEITYTRLDDHAPDRRSEHRRPSRLKWGKILDERDKFLCECLILNRTINGAGLRLAREIAPPQRFQLFEDDRAEIHAAWLVWRRGAEIGCRLSRTASAGKGAVVRRMCGKFYAL